jgi:uncharacterized membrane protein
MSRLTYLDWLRGIAVLIMIEAHTMDAWTRTADRGSSVFGWAVMVGGMGAPLFLFLAGVAVALAAAARARTLGDERTAARLVRRRGWEIFGLAFLFRLQSYVLGHGASLEGLLKVDILNIMGPSIVLAAWIWQWGGTPAKRAAALGAAGTIVALLTPLVRATTVLDPLPDALEAYLRPEAGLATFTFFPWAGFVLAGAVPGVAIAAARGNRGQTRRVATACTAVGIGLALVGYGTSWLPPIYPSVSFWTSSPTFFCLRVGLLALGIGAAFFWEHRPWTHGSGGPMVLLGASSLFVYWIHVEMVYGVLSAPLRRQLPIGGAFAGFLAFSGLMLAVVLVKNRLRRGGRQAGEALPQTAALVENPAKAYQNG